MSTTVSRLTVAGVLLAMLVGSGCSAAQGTQRGVAAIDRASASLRTSDQGESTRLGPTDPDETVDFTLPLVMPGGADVDRFLAALYDPQSPDYRRFLDAQAFGARFGLPLADIDAVVAWLDANHVETVFRAAQRTSLGVRARAGDVNRLFAVTLEDFVTTDGVRFHRPAGQPRLPAPMSGRVAAVVGLDTEPVVLPATPGILASGVPNGGLRPNDVARAYEIEQLQAAGLHGEGQTVAIVSFDTFYKDDIDAWDGVMGVSGPPIESVKLPGAPDEPTGDNDEVTLDIEVIRGIAPAAQIVNYEAANKISNFAAMIAKIVSDGRADLVNISWGKCEKYWPTEAFNGMNQELQAAFAAGISVFVASGDDGAYGCRRNRVSDDPFVRDLTPNVDFPSASSSVIAVGGTYLTVRTDGTYYSEAGWEDPLGGGGGGGGVSALVNRPPWQQGVGVDNGESSGKRQVPDVAGPADPASGFIVMYTPPGEKRQTGGVGGTSAAAPFWVGSMVLVRQLAASRGIDGLGALGPVLYQVAAARPDVFHDVVRGGNLLEQAGPGWDYSTGLGSPLVASLADALISALGQ
jgi:subtilase family serine protease